MRLEHVRADYGYRIEHTEFGLRVHAWGRATLADAHRWARDLRRMVRAAERLPIQLLADTRGHVDYSADRDVADVVARTMAWCQANGVERSAVVSDDAALLLLTRSLARDAATVYGQQRYFNALHNPAWEADALRWLATGEETHWARPEEARAELLLLLDTLREPMALFTADALPLHLNPALVEALGAAPEPGHVPARLHRTLAAHPLGAAVLDLARVLAAGRGGGGADAVADARWQEVDGCPWQLTGRVALGLFGPAPLLLVTATPWVAPPPTDAELAARYGLTAREREIVRRIATGSTNLEIASTLGLRRATVRNHLSSILRKTGATNRTRVAELVLRPGRATPDGR